MSNLTLKTVIFRRESPWYLYYFWPSLQISEMQYNITTDMTSEWLYNDLRRYYKQNPNAKIKISKYKVGELTPNEITDISQFLENETYLVEFS